MFPAIQGFSLDSCGQNMWIPPLGYLSATECPRLLPRKMASGVLAFGQTAGMRRIQILVLCIGLTAVAQSAHVLNLKERGK